MNATISILGLYNYDNTIFDGLDAPSDLDKQTLIDYIMMECANLELLYPDFPIMKRLITSWAGARAHSWERFYQSTVQNYNMIHNYDRYEEWSDTSSRTTSGTSSSTDSTTSHTTGTTSTSKAAYNDTNLTPTERTDSTADATATGTGSNTSSGTENGSGGHEGHLYGNIGVTTAAQMLNEERELYKWDVYQAIAQEFKERFCILVY